MATPKPAHDDHNAIYSNALELPLMKNVIVSQCLRVMHGQWLSLTNDKADEHLIASSTASCRECICGDPSMPCGPHHNANGTHGNGNMVAARCSW